MPSLPFAELLRADIKPETRAVLEEALAAAALESKHRDLAKVERWKAEQAREIRERLKVEANVDGWVAAGAREQAVTALRETVRSAVYARISDLKLRLTMMVVADAVLAELSDAIVLYSDGATDGFLLVDAYARASETTKWQRLFKQVTPGSISGNQALARRWIEETKRLYKSRITVPGARPNNETSTK